MVVKATGGEAHQPFGDKVRAALRMAGTVIRAIDPRAERPPLPDANLANIGGAIIPALGRRWRAKT